MPEKGPDAENVIRGKGHEKEERRRRGGNDTDE
jgi:hypothetical protein